MSNNTTTPSPNILTPELLRQALDRWCKEQPGVIRKVSGAYEACVTTPKLPDGLPFEHWRLIADGEGSSFQLFAGVCWLHLTTLAIEHRYIPWLKLAVTLPYTGAKAARLALWARGEMGVELSLVEMEEPWVEPAESKEPRSLNEILQIGRGGDA